MSKLEKYIKGWAYSIDYFYRLGGIKLAAKYLYRSIVLSVILFLFNNSSWFRKTFKYRLRRSNYGWLMIVHYMWENNRKMSYELYGDYIGYND